MDLYGIFSYFNLGNIMINTPDNWVVFKISGDDPHYKVLAGWSGGYLDADSWRINSGITSVKETATHFEFYGASGSCYKCNKHAYCLRNNNAYVWNELQEKFGSKVSLMDEDTAWLAMDWIISPDI
jgi:hypothetical protein